MATKKKGNITTSPEWARHLRPIMKRWFWKGERNAESVFIDNEQKSLYIQSVEELLEEVESWGSDKNEQELDVAGSLYMNNSSIDANIAMAIVVDKVLEKGYFPSGVEEGELGTKYKYSKEESNDV